MTGTLLKRRETVAAVVVGTAALALLSTGTAFAYFTTAGSGSGTAEVGSDLLLTSALAAAPDLLYPNEQSIGGTVQVTNPNSFTVKVTGITFDEGGVGVTTDKDCTTTGVTFAGSSGLAVVIAAGASAPIPYTVSMSGASSNGCQDADFTASFTLQAVSQ